MTRTRVTAAVLAAALAAVLGAAPAAAANSEYVPFVTDFPRPASPAAEPRPAADGIDWAAVPAEGVAAAVAALAAGTALLVRRRQAGPRLSDC